MFDSKCFTYNIYRKVPAFSSLTLEYVESMISEID